MTDFIAGLLLGAFIGAIAGFFVAALCQAAARADERIESENRGYPTEEEK